MTEFSGSAHRHGVAIQKCRIHVVPMQCTKFLTVLQKQRMKRKHIGKEKEKVRGLQILPKFELYLTTQYTISISDEMITDKRIYRKQIFNIFANCRTLSQSVRNAI